MSAALVTGASSGIGAAFARALHGAGRPLVLVGRDEKRLRRVVRGAPQESVEVLVADLASAAGLQSLRERLDSAYRPIDLVVHAAGRTVSDPFGVGAVEDERAQLHLNVGATMEVLHAALVGMSGRGGGAIITVGSTASVWSLSSYAATKAWQSTLTQAIAERSAETGVRSLLVMPGFTRTELHQRAGVDASAIPPWMWLTPDVVAAESLRALAAGRSTWIPTRRYRALVAVVRLLPLRRRAQLLRRIAPLRPLSRPVGGVHD
ncbi:MAG: SDR family NAD(P)-dependent oxidoreductase [Jatrophihabitantaceae bacterium]